MTIYKLSRSEALCLTVEQGYWINVFGMCKIGAKCK